MGHEFSELIAALNDAVTSGNADLIASLQRKLAEFE